MFRLWRLSVASSGLLQLTDAALSAISPLDLCAALLPKPADFEAESAAIVRYSCLALPRDIQLSKQLHNWIRSRYLLHFHSKRYLTAP